MLRLLLFFPSINFGLLSAEIFPWAMIYSLKQRTLNYRFLVIVLILCFSIFYFAIVTNFDYLFEHIRALFAYINPLFIFFTIMAVPNREIYRIRKLIFPLLLFLMFLGLVQFSGMISFLEPLFEFLIPRSSASSLASIGRGVTMLSTEPARAGYELVFLYAAWRCLTGSNKQWIVIDTLFFVFMVAIIQSAMAVLLTLVYFAFVYKSRFGILLLIVPIFIFVVIQFETRATIIIREIYPIIISPEIFDYFINKSGFRFISMLSAFNFGFDNIFGGGVGLWEITSIEALEGAGFDPSKVSYFASQHNSQFVGLRPTSYASNLALDIGIVGLGMFILLSYKYIRKVMKLPGSDKSIFYLFVFTFFFTGSVGNPVPWIVVALVLRVKEMSKDMAYDPVPNYASSFGT